ncbi:hypothetical protein Bbelb_000440 [Branchiostoma belcheri]|nr:hypothetical protein Bbelb_000440 [Branchiostoma belcheri]
MDLLVACSQRTILYEGPQRHFHIALPQTFNTALPREIPSVPLFCGRRKWKGPGRSIWKQGWKVYPLAARCGRAVEEVYGSVVVDLRNSDYIYRQQRAAMQHYIFIYLKDNCNNAVNAKMAGMIQWAKMAAGGMTCPMTLMTPSNRKIGLRFKSFNLGKYANSSCIDTIGITDADGTTVMPSGCIKPTTSLQSITQSVNITVVKGSSSADAFELEYVVFYVAGVEKESGQSTRLQPGPHKPGPRL